MSVTPGTDFRVTPAELATAAANCNTTAGELQTELAQLKSYVVDLEAQWQGIASQTFATLMTDYDLFSTMLQNALTDIAAGLTGNQVNYSDSETANISGLQQVNGEIPGAGSAVPVGNFS